MKPYVPFALAVLVLATAARAAPSRLEVVGAWSRPAAAGTNGAGYLTVINHGAKPDAVVGVESPAAARSEMHAMSMAGGVMSMRKLDEAPAPAGGKAVFAPGGDHIMLVGLKRPLKLGDKVAGTLRFASGARVPFAFTVAVAPPAER